MRNRRIVVTSALPYANGDIHLGHLVEYLQTDFWVRFQRMRGHDCIYVCADDTHGTPVMIRARAEGITPEELIEKSHEKHVRDFADFDVSFDNYYTSHSPENRELSHLVFMRMEAAGHIDARDVPQLYCEHDGMFLPDRFVRGTCPVCNAQGQYGDGCEDCGAGYRVEELLDPVCSTCGRPPVCRTSEHLFFDVNAYKDYLAEWLPRHTARDVARKLLEWFDEDLRPWDLSRDAPYFGFEIPGHPGKFFYVWVDAPIGYMASLKNWCVRNGRDFDTYWNAKEAELYHFIGKDIARFHCLFWPAMLRCAGLKGPDKVFVHGFLTVNGEKMSKSKGTFINARTYLNHLDPQYLRFYYACKLNGTTDDIDLNVADFVARVNSDLVGKIANLASRAAQMLHKSLDGRLGRPDGQGRELLRETRAAAETVARNYEERDFSRAMVEIRNLADRANRYFDTQAPWQLVKQDAESARSVLTAVLNIFRLLALFLKPVLPEFASRAERLFGEEAWDWSAADRDVTNLPINSYEYLAQRIRPDSFEKIIEESRADRLEG